MRASILLAAGLLGARPAALGTATRGVQLSDASPARVLAAVVSTRPDPPLLAALDASIPDTRALVAPDLTARAIEELLSERLATAGPHDLVVLSVSLPMSAGGEPALLGADARVQGGLLRGALTLERLEDLLLESAAERVIVLIEPTSTLSVADARWLDEAIAEVSRARAGLLVARVPQGASALCVRDRDGDGLRSLDELAAALGTQLPTRGAPVALPWAADRCAPPGSVTVCLRSDGEPVPPSWAFRQGASLGLAVAPVAPGYLTLLAMEGEGAPRPLFPGPGEPPLVVDAAGEVALPPGGEALRLSGPAGVERLGLLWSATSLSDAGALAEALRRARGAPPPVAATRKAVDRCLVVPAVGDERVWIAEFELTRQ